MRYVLGPIGATPCNERRHRGPDGAGFMGEKQRRKEALSCQHAMASVEKRSKTLQICLCMRDALQRALMALLILLTDAMGNRNKCSISSASEEVVSLRLVCVVVDMAVGYCIRSLSCRKASLKCNSMFILRPFIVRGKKKRPHMIHVAIWRRRYGEDKFTAS